MELKELLKTAFNAGINAGIIQVGHQLGMLKDKKEKTFEEFCNTPLIASMIEKLVCKPNN